MEKQKILVSKISIPEILPTYEQRTKQLSELSMVEGKLLMLRATVGYGKTVLMSQYARLPGHICAWYHLDSLDNDFTTFVRYLVLSLDRALGGFDFDAEQLCYEAEPEWNSLFSRKLTVELEDRLETMDGQRLVLALDNLQLLKNPEIFKLLEEILDHTGPRFLLATATRGDVPDLFTKYFLRHQGILIEPDQLNLCRAEIRCILDRMLPQKDMERYAEMIWRNTEGWPAGVMLTALYLCRLDDGEPDVGWDRISRESWVENYITYELYKGLSHDIQRFLLRTSFAEELQPKLCDHLCRIHNAEDILQYLMRENMFLRRVDGQTDSYRYHPLFRNFLNSKAGDELKRSMYKKIADYYLKLQDNSNAEKYAIKAERKTESEGPLLQVSCFGRFRVVILKTGREMPWRTRKTLELFAYLVDLEGRPVERRALLEHLWPDDAPNNEVAMLHNMIYSIRKELRSQPEFKKLIQYKRQRYYLDGSLIRTDLNSKKQICRLAEMGKAGELYERREELLKPWGAYLKEVEGTWCMARRTYFERTYGKACSLLADYCRKKGDLETEASCWSAYMAADRYSEEAVAGLLRCYAAMGERQQMQRLFETAQKIFRNEMGIELGPEIMRIYEQAFKTRKR